MTGKDVAILSVVKSEEERRAEAMRDGGRRKAARDLTDLTLLPREEREEENEFVISQVAFGLSFPGGLRGLKQGTSSLLFHEDITLCKPPLNKDAASLR